MLTQKLVDTYPLATDGRTYIKDEKTPGLSLVVGKTKKSWRYQRDVKGKAVAMVLDGAHTLAEARAWALEQKVLIARGHDPQAKSAPPTEKPSPLDWTVRQLMERRLEYMRANSYSEAAIADFQSSMKYLTLVPGFMVLPVRELTKSKCAEAHRAITLMGVRKPAPVQANKAMDYLSASWRYAKDKLDDHSTMLLIDNPTKGADRNPVGKVQASIDNLPLWREVVDRLSPVKRHMHRIGLLTGLRWTTLRAIEKEWIAADRITIPAEAMKSRRNFIVPLSAPLRKEVEQAVAAANFVAPGSRYLFPSPTSITGYMATDDDRALIAKGWPGKLRRKTYRTQAERLDIPRNVIRALMDHTAPGMDGNYLHDAAMFDDLLRWQEKISVRLVALMVGK